MAINKVKTTIFKIGDLNNYDYAEQKLDDINILLLVQSNFKFKKYRHR